VPACRYRADRSNHPSRIARDRQRRIHGVAHRLRRKIGGAGIAALLADVGGDAQALVAVVLDGFDLAMTHRDALAETFDTSTEAADAPRCLA